MVTRADVFSVGLSRLKGGISALGKHLSLSGPLTSLRGIGAKRQTAFERLGIRTLGDLLHFYPRTYEDRRQLHTIATLSLDEPCRFLGMVASEPVLSRLQGNRTLLKFRVVDETGSIQLLFFNRPYSRSQFTVGQTFQFYGQAVLDSYGLSMTSPQYEPVADETTPDGDIQPVYPLTAGLTNHHVSSAVQAALEACVADVPETLPDDILTDHALLPIQTALRQIHFPSSPELLDAARRRIAFDECFLLTAALSFLKHRRSDIPGRIYPRVSDAPLREQIPFALTDAQERVVTEGLADLQSGRVMNRLIQGDVGSGKTIVAVMLAYQVLAAGDQVILMAPTEILATQHFATFQKLLRPLGWEPVLLTGKLKAAQRREISAAIESGAANMIIGTHAVLSEGIRYASPGLVICDEQQRFGVQQRAALTAKGLNPHLLVMSATPIPRTLALILYGDLDVSVIDELPPGRQKVDTFLVGPSMRTRIEAFIRKQVEEGHQAYIVCPLIDESEDATLQSVLDYTKKLSEVVFPDLKIACLHGRLKGAEKENVMRAFVSGEISVLVSTTVVEVGVDNPNATLMVIENAERFGLSQLHQLRGRVGRGQAKSYCILACGHGSKSIRDRLEILCRSNNGYEIAQRDLELRGPGTFFGDAQHGLTSLKLASLSSDMALLREAQDAARQLMEADSDLSQPTHTPLRSRIVSLFHAEAGNSMN